MVVRMKSGNGFLTRKSENAGFKCIECGREVQPLARGTIRDHCPSCLSSLHVDIVPGDRACECRGVLRPVAVEYNGKKGYILASECSICGIVKRNRTAPDDSLDAIIKVQKEQSRKLLG